jgi:prevent-host-death family protein
MQKIAAAQFKAQCLAVVDQVSQSGCPVVITKHGKPVVKLVPANEGEDEIFGAWPASPESRALLRTRSQPAIGKWNDPSRYSYARLAPDRSPEPFAKSKENHFGDVPQAAGDVARSRW